MTTSITKPELCYLNTMTSLEKNSAAPMNIMQGTPFLDTIMQSRFTDGWMEGDAARLAGKAAPTLPSVNPGINLRRKYYTYEKPYCESDTDETCKPNICAGGTVTDEQTGYLATDIDQCVSETWSITKAEFLQLAETPSERRATMLRRKAWNLKKKLNRFAITQVYAALSDYFDGNPSIGGTTKNVTILKSDGKIAPVGMSRVYQEYTDVGFTGDFVIFGGRTLSTFYNTNRWQISPEGRLGTDLSDGSLPFVYDPIFDEIFQTLEANTLSHGVSIPVGSFALDFYNMYTGEMVDVFEDKLSTTLEIDGLTYDYQLYYDKCEQKWTEQLSLNWGYLTIPDAAYCNGIGLIKHWTFSCGDIDCDSFC